MTLLDAALRYAARSCPVFPLVPRDKVPLIAKTGGGRGFHDATTDADQIRDWWTRRSDANIGIATGHAFDVLDVDTDHGGEETLAALEAEHGPLSATVEATTGSGGRHILFLPDARVRCSAGRLGPGLDVRGLGGYVVVPPSVHPSGRRYRWFVTGVPLAPWPPWLVVRLLPAAPSGRPGRSAVARVRAEGCTYYGAAVLRRACEAIECATEGERHSALRRRARVVGGFVASGEIAADVAQACLALAADAAGLPEHEAASALKWGLAHGAESPLRAPGRWA